MTIFGYTIAIKKRRKGNYLKAGRLQDVIRLISVLSLDKDTFRQEKYLVDAIRSKPSSAQTLFEVAFEHAEFFRPNKENDHIALLFRSFLPITSPNDKSETTRVLTVDETQKNLLTLLFFLHDKELSRTQRFGYLFPLLASVISGIVALASIYYSCKLTHRIKYVGPTNFNEIVFLKG